MQRVLTFAFVPIAILGAATEGAGCTMSIEPISGSGEDAGVVDSGMRTQDATTDEDVAPPPMVDAGAGSCTVLATSYDRSCTTAGDCVAVQFGQTCTSCAAFEATFCGESAINSSAVSAYTTALANHSNQFRSEVEECDAAVPQCPVDPREPQCVNNVCVMGSGDGGGAGECSSDGIAFDLTVDAAGPVYFGGPQPPWLDSFGCPSWLAIAPAGESPLNLTKGGCFVGCPAFRSEPATAQSYTWDGTYYPTQESYDASSCGGLPSCGCQTPTCAPPGNYVATICVGYAGEDAGPETAPPTCKQVPFVWPPTSAKESIVESITPTPDGG